MGLNVFKVLAAVAAAFALAVAVAQGTVSVVGMPGDGQTLLLEAAMGLDLARVDKITFEGDHGTAVMQSLVLSLALLLALALVARIVFVLLIRPKRRPPAGYPTAPWPPQ